MKNVRTTRPSKKLDWKYAGPFKILDRVGINAFKLELPPTVRMHNVINIQHLEPYHTPTMDELDQMPEPVEVDG
nr:transposon Ty3-G Gag-Pol polyprotein [Tanacetum cinerariifolium]